MGGWKEMSRPEPSGVDSNPRMDTTEEGSARTRRRASESENEHTECWKVFYIVNWNSNCVPLKSFVYFLDFLCLFLAILQFSLAIPSLLCSCIARAEKHFQDYLKWTVAQDSSENKPIHTKNQQRRKMKSIDWDLWLVTNVCHSILPNDESDDQMMIWFYAKFVYRIGCLKRP